MTGGLACGLAFPSWRSRASRTSHPLRGLTHDCADLPMIKAVAKYPKTDKTTAQRAGSQRNGGKCARTGGKWQPEARDRPGVLLTFRPGK